MLAFSEVLRKNNGQMCSGLAKSVTEKNNEGKVREGYVGNVADFLIRI